MASPRHRAANPRVHSGAAVVTITYFTFLRTLFNVHFMSPNPGSRPFLCSGTLRCKDIEVQAMTVKIELHKTPKVL
jgi:hypothetical protein